MLSAISKQFCCLKWRSSTTACRFYLDCSTFLSELSSYNARFPTASQYWRFVLEKKSHRIVAQRNTIVSQLAIIVDVHNVVIGVMGLTYVTSFGNREVFCMRTSTRKIYSFYDKSNECKELWSNTEYILITYVCVWTLNSAYSILLMRQRHHQWLTAR